MPRPRGRGRSGRDRGVAGEDVVWVPRAGEDAQEVARSMASVIGSRIGWKIMETDVVWPGRSMDRINWSGAEVVLSAAHNSESLSHDLGRLGSERHVLVVGMTQKEDLSESIGRFSVRREEDPDNRNRGPRREDPVSTCRTLSSLLSADSEGATPLITEPIEAIDKASRIAIDEDIVYVTGSVYLVGQAIEEAFSRRTGDMRNTSRPIPKMTIRNRILV